MRIGVNLSLVQMAVRQMLGGSAPWTPATLFASSEPGAWYDPSDLGSLWQDSAGTTPVTAVEQPVGLMLDKSQGLTTSAELLTNPGPFSATTGWTGSANCVLSTASSRLVATYASTDTFYQAIPVEAGKWYFASATLKRDSGSGTAFVNFRSGTTLASGVVGNWTSTGTTSSSDVRLAASYYAASSGTVYLHLPCSTSGTTVVSLSSVSVNTISGNHAYQTNGPSRPVLSARYNLLTNTETLSTQSVTTQATDYKLRFTGTGTITLSGTKTGVYTAGTHTLTGVTAGTLTATVAGVATTVDLRPANLSASLPAYQRVNTATDYDTVGFPLYIRSDGADDRFIGPAISNVISAAAYEACVGASVVSVSTSSASPWLNQTLVADDAGYVGIGYLTTSNVIGAFNFDGSTDTVTTAMTPPSTFVLQQRHDAGNLTLSLNGNTESSVSSGNTQAVSGLLRLFSSNGSASVPARLYGCVIRNSAFTASERANLLTWMNGKTKAYA